MKSLSDIVLVTCLALLALISCDDNELEVDKVTPTVKAKFINNDSLEQVNLLLVEINAEIQDIDDSIKALDALIDGGDNTNYSENYTSLDEMRDELTKEKKEVNAIKSTINSGKLYIQKISGSGAVDDITFEDSTANYTLPLNVNADISDFIIQITDTVYTLSLSYKRDTVVKEGFIAIEASQLKLVEYTKFDSVTFPCDTLNCESYEATATIYF